MWDRQGDLEGGTSRRKEGDGSYLGHTLPCHGGEGREQGQSLKYSIFLVLLCAIEKYRHTQTHVQPLPILFITVSS